MATVTHDYTGTLNIIECAGCHMDFGVLPFFQRNRRDDHKTFYCPKGCHNFYPQKSTEEQLRKDVAVLERKLDNALSREVQQQERAVSAERTARALRGHLTRYRKRVANGVCPVAGCHRHFPNVQAHVETVHADWLTDHPEVFEGSS